MKIEDEKPTPDPEITPEPAPIEPAPEPENEPDILGPMAKALGMTPDEFKAALAGLKKPAPKADPTPEPEPEAKPDDADLSAEVKERNRADSEKTRADRAEATARRYATLQNAQIEAEALDIVFHTGALAKLHRAGDFDAVTFDAEGEPENVREVVEQIATDNPWAVKRATPVNDGARDNGRASSLISDDDVADAARRYGIRR